MKWREDSLENLNDCKIFTVQLSEQVSSDNKRAKFVVLDTPDWVNVIVPLRKGNGGIEFLMVRQFRHGSREITCEFPAGAIDGTETPEQAAARELREETGYEAERLTVIGSVCPNPAFMNNRVYTVLAENAVCRHNQDFDEHEYVETALVNADTVMNDMGTGEYDNGVMLMALFFYRRYMEEKKNKK
ncbi:MAG: NUDIX hydrolase [Spirochaetales bacterium]|nr:NUDIX hydrolase [Spirochaetales bacterium]